MHIILGANGHIGSVIAQTLLERNEPVTVVIHDAKKVGEWKQKGVHVAVADVHDVETLRRIFQQGERLFLLNPPADPSTDTSLEERKSAGAILAALAGSGLKKVVAQSAYGAQPGERIGDLSFLYEMEQALGCQPTPTTILRGAYFMSNWDMSLQTAREEGKVHTFYPTDFKLPMVAPHDIGLFAAGLMTEEIESTGLRCIEGPQHYSTDDVAAAFASALNKPVEAVETPRDQWKQALQTMGFSEPAAQSFANMNAVTLDQQSAPPVEPVRGSTSLQQYIEELVRKNPPHP